MQAEKAELTTQLKDRIDKLEELSDQLEAKNSAADQREAELQEVLIDCIPEVLLMYVAIHSSMCNRSTQSARGPARCLQQYLPLAVG